jgi:predicted nucleotidyltransferase
MLQALFSSEARIKLLKTLLLESDGRYYLRELAVKTGVSPGNARRELLKLVEAGILVREGEGHQTYYRVNELCPIIPELLAMFVKTVGVADVLRSALAGISERIRWAFIYGSFAKGTQRSESDVDLMVIGSVAFSEVVTALREAQDRLNREINPSVYSAEEYVDRARRGERFISNVQSDQKILVIGDENALSRLAEVGLGDQIQDRQSGGPEFSRCG